MNGQVKYLILGVGLLALPLSSHAQDLIGGASSLGIYNLPASQSHQDPHPGTASYGSSTKKADKTYKSEDNRYLLPYFKKDVTNPARTESISTKTDILIGYITSDGMIRHRIGTPPLGRIPNFKSDQHAPPIFLTGHLDPQGKVTDEKGQFIGLIKADGTMCDTHGITIGKAPQGNITAGALLILGTHASEQIL